MSSPLLIIGAGPVGLTAAAALTHRGIPCRILDKAPAPTDKSKALAVWCRTMELLDGLGLAEIFVRTGLKLTGGSIYADGKRVVHLNLTSDESPFGFPLMIPQNETERLLTDYLSGKGVRVERPVELLTFQQMPDCVACILRHADGREETVETPWLIGCDGAHSTVRHTLGLKFTGHAEPNDWILADVHMDGTMAQDEVSVFWGADGVLAFFPMGGNRFRVIADLGPATEAPRPEVTLADTQKYVDNRGPGGLTLSDPVWLSNFRINERKVADYCKGRVLLAGDAAHIHSPAGGQGMNTGMQDAFNLAWKLALLEQRPAHAEPLLRSYSVERSAVGDQVLANAERFTTVATLRSPVAQWLRNHFAPILTSFPIVQEKIRENWFELSINYRHSPLTEEHWSAPSGSVLAGDRLPDAPLVSSDGRATTLFEAIRGTTHTLLLFPVMETADSADGLVSIAREIEQDFPGLLALHLIAPADVPAVPAISGIPVWIDQTSRLSQLFPVVSDAFVLVRPDGYIGLRSQPADGRLLRDHLARYVVPAT